MPPESRSTGIWEMKGKVTLSPGSGHTPDAKGNKCYRFRFVNTTEDPICDLSIRTFDLDFLGASPDILPGDPRSPKSDTKPGVTIERVKYKDNKIDSRETIEDWERTNSDEEDDDTKIVFKEGACIGPNEFFDVVLCFDETLDENEGVTFYPSHKGGEGFTGTTETPDPLTWGELFEILGKIGGAVAPFLGQAPTNKSRRDVSVAKLQRVDMGTAIAVRESLDRRYERTSFSELPSLPLSAIQGISESKAAMFSEMGLVTIKDFCEDPNLQKIWFLYNLSS